MGGLAFSAHSLPTPRIPPDTYFQLKQKYHDILTKLFVHVTTPPEAPAKTSYGDIDYLVAEPITPIPQELLDLIPEKPSNGKTPTQARRTPGPMPLSHLQVLKAAFKSDITIDNADTTSFAAPREDENGETIYAQIDVHVCSSAEQMHWIAFKHAYGDMWSILGMIARAKHLLADEQCLNVMIPEIEPHDKKKSKVELTRDVGEVLDFFGLDRGWYEKGFKDLEECFGFITSCRFYDEKYYTERRWSRAADRKKLRKREMMEKFFKHVGGLLDEEEYGVDDDGIGGQSAEELKVQEQKSEESEEVRVSRRQVIEEALDRFGKREVYEEKVTDWRRAQRIQDIVSSVVQRLVEAEVCSIKSARRRASGLRKLLTEGLLDRVFDMDELEIEKFVCEEVDKITQDVRNQTPFNLPCSEADTSQKPEDLVPVLAAVSLG